MMPGDSPGLDSGHLHVVIDQFSSRDGSPLVSRVVFDGGDATGGHDVLSCRQNIIILAL